MIHGFEWMLLIAALVVVVGLVGEHKIPWWRPIYDWFVILVAVGCIGELAADGGIFFLSRHLQTISDAEVSTALAQSRYANLLAQGAAVQAAALQEEAELLKKQAEDEKLKRVEIEESIAWRRLTKKQQLGIASRLSRFRGQIANMWYGAGDKEAETFALEIASALNEAKWTVYAPAALLNIAEAGHLFNPSSPSLETGVSVSGPIKGVGRNASKEMVCELKNLGFDAIILPDSRRTHPDTPLISITVHVRPEGPQGEAKLRQQREGSSRPQIIK